MYNGSRKNFNFLQAKVFYFMYNQWVLVFMIASFLSSSQEDLTPEHRRNYSRIYSESSFNEDSVRTFKYFLQCSGAGSSLEELRKEKSYQKLKKNPPVYTF